MRKEAKMLLLTGGLVAAGLALSFFGTILAVHGLVQFESNVSSESYSVTVELDPQDGEFGIMALIVRDDSKDNDIFSRVYGPSGLEIATMSTDGNGQTEFPVMEKGKYEVTVENNLDTVIPIILAVGTNSSSLAQAVTITGTAVLLMGLLGMVATTVYVFRLKRKG